jgi:hypothetical protein
MPLPNIFTPIFYCVKIDVYWVFLVTWRESDVFCLVSRLFASSGLNSNVSDNSLTLSTAPYYNGRELILPSLFLVYAQGQVISLCAANDQENRKQYCEATSCMRPHFFLKGYSTDVCLVF